jgi:hypothetical protein
MVFKPAQEIAAPSKGRPIGLARFLLLVISLLTGKVELSGQGVDSNCWRLSNSVESTDFDAMAFNRHI